MVEQASAHTAFSERHRLHILWIQFYKGSSTSARSDSLVSVFAGYSSKDTLLQGVELSRMHAGEGRPAHTYKVAFHSNREEFVSIKTACWKRPTVDKV